MTIFGWLFVIGTGGLLLLGLLTIVWAVYGAIRDGEFGFGCLVLVVLALCAAAVIGRFGLAVAR